MYFVTGAGNLKGIAYNLIKDFFADKAEVNIDSYGKLFVKVKEDAGFKDEEKLLTKRQIAEDFYGGGLIQGLDGKLFEIKVTEIKDE